jgi:hypothetical protein
MHDAEKFHEESVELKRLEEEHIRAEINANAVLTRRGINSLEFLEANETVRDLVSRIKRLKVRLASRNWTDEPSRLP